MYKDMELLDIVLEEIRNAPEEEIDSMKKILDALTARVKEIEKISAPEMQVTCIMEGYVGEKPEDTKE